VAEARRIKMSEERIAHYLKTEWLSELDFTRLARSVNVDVQALSSKASR
jgi:hypothetical protein